MPDIDYDALAKQFGGTDAVAPPAAAPVDYDALAKQFGGTDPVATPATPPTKRQQADSGADAVQNFVNQQLSPRAPVLPTPTPGKEIAPPSYQIGAPAAPPTGPLIMRTGIPEKQVVPGSYLKEPSFQEARGQQAQQVSDAIDTAFPFLVGPFRLEAGLMKEGAKMATDPVTGAIVAGTAGLGAVPGMAARTIETGLSAYFATQAGKAFLEKAPEVAKQVKAGDWQGAAETGGSALADAIVTFGTASHAIGNVKAAGRAVASSPGLRDLTDTLDQKLSETFGMSGETEPIKIRRAIDLAQRPGTPEEGLAAKAWLHKKGIDPETYARYGSPSASAYSQSGDSDTGTVKPAQAPPADAPEGGSARQIAAQEQAAETAPVDYDALAKQFGGTDAEAVTLAQETPAAAVPETAPAAAPTPAATPEPAPAVEKDKQVDIKVQDAEGNASTTPVTADVTGDLAVHDRIEGFGYSVTHIPSGLSVTTETKQQADEIAAKLTDSGIDLSGETIPEAAHPEIKAIIDSVVPSAEKTGEDEPAVETEPEPAKPEPAAAPDYEALAAQFGGVDAPEEKPAKAEVPAVPVPDGTQKPPAKAKPAPQSEQDAPAATDAVRPQDSRPLEGVSPADGERPSGGGETSADGVRGPGVGGERVLGPDSERPVGGPGGRDHAGVVDGTEGTTARPARQRKPSVETRPHLSGYRITPADRLGEGSLTDKANQNVEAIRLLKHIEGEGRPATPEEQRALVKYTGWGAITEPFENWQNTPAMRAVKDALKEMLTPEEWKSIAATTPNAHYTSETAIGAIWDAVERLGVKPGSSILEPSMGAGHFFGLMPDSLIPGVKLAGVEIDPVTARIASLLYPNAGTYPTGFEKTRFPDNWFDLAISNVPFGNYGVHDPAFKGARRGLSSSIHNYFFAKALDKVRPGGIVAFVTSRYTMDAKDPSVREYLAKHAKLLGAIRLPQTAFEKNAGTTVVTDVIFLQKRVPGDASEGESWTTTSPTDLFPGDENNPTLNDYYREHPEMVLGKTVGNRGRFGPEINVTGELTKEKLAAAIARLPENVVTDWKPSEAFSPNAIALAEYPEASHVKEGAYGVVDGKLVQRKGEMLEPLHLAKDAAARVTGMIAVREAMHDVFRTQLQDKPDAEITAARKTLGKVYDQFVRKFGALNDRENARAFKEDPDAQPILALEKLNRETKTVAKTDIFTQPTLQTYRPVASAGTAKEAMTISLNEYGRINWIRMAQLTGRDAADLQDELGDLIFRDENLQWVPADEYLSGDIRQKLAQMREMAKADKSFDRNVTALEAAKPPDLHAGEIVARLGAPWVPTGVVEQFVADLLGVNARNVSVAYSPAIATWRLVLGVGKASAKNTSEWAGGDMPADELIEQAMNMKVPTVRVKVSSDPDKYAVDPKATAAAQDMQQKLKNRFKDWVWESPTRTEALEKLYNDTYNGIRLREYDGSHLTLTGSNPAIELRKHQKNAIWRIVSSGRNTLLAHVVGAGKTFEMIGAAMEMRRLGLAKKPMLTVPANIVGQIGRDFRLLYPAANILVADEETFNAKNRQKAMGHVATGNWDAVIVSHDAFGLLPVHDDTFNAFLQKEIDTLEDAIRESKAGQADKKITKELEKSKKRLEAKLRDKADREGKDDSLTFEELGIDALFVDEADLFKNLYFTTRATRIAGIPNSESNRAFDMLIKSRHVTDKTGGRLIFATGTPIANTVAEMYTMLRYLSHKELDARSLGQFDAWAQQFGESVTGLETSPDGAGFRMNTRFAKFSNLPELQSLFRQVADVQTADMLKLPVPKLFNGKYETITVPASKFLLDYIMAKDEKTGEFLPGTLMGRIQAIKSGKVDPREDNMLKVTSDGRKAALDLRLIGERVDPAESKVNTAVKRIHEIWKEGAEKKTTQMVFSDLSTPSSSKWNVYDEIRRKLTLKGVPASEIAYAHDADTEAKKAALMAAVNAGRIRILIGSTGKMGAGTNAQERMIALHHLDVPWRPRDVEQREGRIRRQGNTNPEIHIVRYVTAPSFDAYMWGMVTRKAKFINQVMTGDTGVREAEDIGGDSLGAAEAEAAATGNPLIKEKADIDNQVMRLGALQSEHARKQISARIERDRVKQNIERSTIWIPRLEADIATRDANTSKDFSMKVGGKTYTERKEAGEALNQFAVKRRMDEEITKAGTYRGFDVNVQGRGAERLVAAHGAIPDSDMNPPRLTFHGAGTHFANLNPLSAVGTIASLDAELRGMDRQLEQAHAEVDKAKADLKQYGITAETPYADGALLDKLVKRQKEIIAALDLGAQAPANADDTAPETTKLSKEAGQLVGALKPLSKLADAVLKPVVDLGADIQNVFFPQTVNAASETTGLSLREHNARFAASMLEAETAMEKVRDFMAKQPQAFAYDFIDRMEHGQPQADHNLDVLARILKDWLDKYRDDIQSLGSGKLASFYENYFPHIWKNPKGAQATIATILGRRPIEGKKGFLKKRKHVTFADGLAAGLEPVSDNPVDLVLLKLHEMGRYLLAHRFRAEMKTLGTARFISESKRGKVPKDWYEVPDPIGIVYGPMTAEGSTTIRGRYYMPKAAITIVKNHLMPGLGYKSYYQLFRQAGNLMLQFSLGFSGFHAGFVTFEAMISKGALAMKYAAAGMPLKAIQTAVTVPLAPIENLLLGRKVINALVRPAFNADPEIAKYADYLQMAGGRARMDDLYRTKFRLRVSDALREAFAEPSIAKKAGALLKATAMSIPALAELSVYPVMEWLVPNMKVGAFAQMAKFEIARLGTTASREDIRKALANAWDSVDNRFGQLIYENKFWNRIAKDILMITVRSPGWNAGTAGEVLGGAFDYAKNAGRVFGKVLEGAGGGNTGGGASGGKSSIPDPEFTHKMSYLPAMAAITAITGAVMNWLNTHDDKKTHGLPQSAKDVFWPRTGEYDAQGNPRRIALWGYVNDIFHWYIHPWDTAVGKINPFVTWLKEEVADKTWDHRQIADPNDPLTVRLEDRAKHTLGSFQPISIDNIRKAIDAGDSPALIAGKLLGLREAPGYIDKSPAELMMSEKFAEAAGSAATPAERYDRSHARREIAAALRSGQLAKARELAKADIKAGAISKEDLAKAAISASKDPFSAQYKALPLEAQLEVWRVSSDEEKTKEVKQILLKLLNVRDQSPEEMNALRKHYADVFAEIRSKLKRAA